MQILDFSNIEIDGKSVGSIVEAAINYPDLAVELIAECDQYLKSKVAAAAGLATLNNEQAQAQVRELTSQLAALSDVVDAQRHQLGQLIIQDWPKLIADLRDAGFFAWTIDAGAASRKTPNEGDSAIAALAIQGLANAADQGDRVGVIRAYVTLMNFLLPSVEQMTAWQSVLDRQVPPVPKNVLYFLP